jgi:hypothetical protein
MKSTSSFFTPNLTQVNTAVMLPQIRRAKPTPRSGLKEFLQVNRSVRLVAVLLLSACGLGAADAKSIQSAFLDDRVVYTIPVSSNRVTTISFPAPIAAIDSAGVTTDSKIAGLFQLAHTKGSSFFSVRALSSGASANLNVRWNKQTYVFELVESPVPILSLNLQAMPIAQVASPPEVNPMKLLALLDKAKAFPLLKQQHPEMVSDVDFTTYDRKGLVSDFDDYAIRIDEAFRFNPEDTIVFRVALTNRTEAVFRYQPNSFMLRAGNRLYPQSISDASGIVPPKGESVVYFAVTGTPDGGRNELSLKNAFTVLVTRRPVANVAETPKGKETP